MINALFVDGNAELLAGVQRNFFSRRNRLNVLVASSIDQALQIAAGQTIDVVLSDMDLSNEKGVELLRRIRERKTGTVRVVTSDHIDKDDSFASATVAHRFLPKPSEVNALADVIFLSCEWRDRVRSSEVAEALTDAPSFSSDPEVLREFNEVLSGETTAAKLAAIARRDPALTMKLLQLQTSSFFGPARDSADLTVAISFLHFDVLRELMSSPGFVQTDVSLDPAAAAVVKQMRTKCLDAAERAATRSADRGAQTAEVEEAWIIGLLSGVGAQITAEVAPQQLGGGGLHEHSATSAYVAHLWGMPTAVREALEAFADRRPSNFAFSFAS